MLREGCSPRAAPGSVPLTRAARSQDNFDFFERAVAFLRTASDDELAACVGTYARFLRTAANSDGRSSDGVPCFAVELCWRVHLLSPFIYAKYCEKNFGKLIDHVALPVGEYPIEAPDSAELAGDAPSAKPLAAFLVPAIRRQQEFMEKMLARRGVMESPEYMSAAVESYVKFLGLMKKHEGVTLVPTLAIDLIWHTHQYYPVRYAAECEAVAGRAINHDDSIEDDELAEDLSETEKLWESAYGQPYLRPPASFGSGSGLTKKLGSGLVLLAGLAAVVGSSRQYLGVAAGVSELGAHRPLQSTGPWVRWRRSSA